MSGLSDPSSLQLPSSFKLRGSDNYTQWKSRVKLILQSKGLQDFILSTNVKPEPTSNASDEVRTVYQTWLENDAKAQLAIVMNVASEPADLVADLRTTYSIWEALQKQYEGAGFNLKHQYFTELVAIDYTKFDLITAFIIYFRKLVSNLAQVDIKLPDVTYIILFLNAL